MWPYHVFSTFRANFQIIIVCQVVLIRFHSFVCNLFNRALRTSQIDLIFVSLYIYVCVSLYVCGNACVHAHASWCACMCYVDALAAMQVLLREIEDYRLTLDSVNRLGQQLMMNNARIPRLTQQVQAQLQNLEESYMNLQSTAHQIRVSTPHPASCTQHRAVSFQPVAGWSDGWLVGQFVCFCPVCLFFFFFFFNQFFFSVWFVCVWFLFVVFSLQSFVCFCFFLPPPPPQCDGWRNLGCMSFWSL